MQLSDTQPIDDRPTDKAKDEKTLSLAKIAGFGPAGYTHHAQTLCSGYRLNYGFICW